MSQKAARPEEDAFRLAARKRGATVVDEALGASRPHRLLALVLSGLITLLYLAPSIYMMQVYDRVLSTGAIPTLLVISAVLVAALGTLTLLDGARSRVLARASLRLDRRLRDTLIAAGFGAVTRRDMRGRQVMREFDNFRAIHFGQPATAMLDMIYAPIFIIVSFMLHPVLGLLVVAGGAVLALAALLNDLAIRKAVQSAADQTPRLYASQEADQQQADTARALGMLPELVRRHSDARSELNDRSTVTAFQTARYGSVVRFVRLVLQSAALGVGAWLAIIQEITPGALIAASILTGRALGPIEQIVTAWRQIGAAQSSRRAVEEALGMMPNPVERMHLPPPTGALRVEGVGVRAPDGQSVLLNQISFAIDAGDALGVIGPSGAGKSTLARILAGARPPEAGLVRLDGSNIRDWDPDILGRHIGYLPQEVGLFAGTIAQNISRFRTDMDATRLGEAVVEAATAAGAHALVQQMPKGYDTVLGPNGEGVSAGQAQRIAFARALFDNPKLLVLDEPNAHLDGDGENALVSAIADVRKRGGTVIIVTHRAGVLRVANKLLVLRKGAVEHFGSTEEVSAKLRAAAGHPTSVVPTVVKTGGA